MHVSIGTTRAIVAERDPNDPQQTRRFRDLGVGEYVTTMIVPDNLPPDQRIKHIIAALQWHKHENGHVEWVECTDQTTRAMLLRHFDLSYPAAINRPLTWGQPKSDEENKV